MNWSIYDGTWFLTIILQTSVPYDPIRSSFCKKFCKNLLLHALTNIVAGIPIKSTLDAPTTVQLAASIQNLCTKGRNCIREMDPTNDLTFLRLRSRKHEIMCAPGQLADIFSVIYIERCHKKNLTIKFKQYLVILYSGYNSDIKLQELSTIIH